MKLLKTERVHLDSMWEIRLLLPNYTRYIGGELYSVDVQFWHQNGEDFELHLEGQVKREGGCFDFGYAKQVMIHGCGREDAKIFKITYDMAEKFMEEYNLRLYYEEKAKELGIDIKYLTGEE